MANMIEEGEIRGINSESSFQKELNLRKMNERIDLMSFFGVLCFGKFFFLSSGASGSYGSTVLMKERIEDRSCEHLGRIDCVAE